MKTQFKNQKEHHLTYLTVSWDTEKKRVKGGSIMKQKLSKGFKRSCLICMLLIFVAAPNGYAKEILGFSTSAQLYDIYPGEVLKQFEAQTGTTIDLTITSSAAAMQRLFNGMSDVAGTAERVKRTVVDYGYTEIPICSAPLVVIAHPGTSVGDLSQAQLQDIFSGKIKNWKEVGGQDEEIIVVVPGKDTAALKNFSQLALKRFDIRYDIMTYRSTMVVQIVSHIPGSISFITKGSDTRDVAVSILKVNGQTHTDKDYPYFQNFSLVIKGKPSKTVSAFVDFLTSEKMQKTLTENGIAPQKP